MNTVTTKKYNFSSQRVGVFVDVQNLYYSAKALYQSKVNFQKVLSNGLADRQLIRALAYVIKAEVAEEKNFFDALEKIGYEIRSKDLQTFYGGNKKGDWDVGIAMDIMRLASKLDVVVLASGDGDFKDLLVHAKALGCRVEVLAFKQSASANLLEVADRFVNLGVGANYLIKPRNLAPRRLLKSSSVIKAV